MFRVSPGKASPVELTWASAFSSEGALGHAAYFLLVLSMLMRRMFWLRLLVIASALVAIAYAALILTDPVSTMWETLLVVVNVLQLTLSWWMDRRTQFDTRESRLKDLHFPNLSPHRMRRLLKIGRWQELPAGLRLATAGEPIQAAYFVYDGMARVEIEGRSVGRCAPDSFVGEMTASTGEPAFADVVLEVDSVLWQIDAVALRRLMTDDPLIGHALEAAFFRMMRRRLADSNALIAGIGGAPMREGAVEASAAAAGVKGT